ncbi:MAG: dipeptidyl-peptidase 3 family protein [Bacteroidota bacterium]
MRSLALHLLVSIMILTTVSCTKEAPPKVESAVAKKIKRFAPAELAGDAANLSPNDRQALDKLIEAAKLMTRIYIRQMWSGNEELFARLQQDTTAAGKERLQLFTIELGPWSSLDNDSAFVDGVPSKPHHANFYPDDMTKEEFETWVATLPEMEKKKATGFFHTVRRNADRSLKLVPYSEEYRDVLEPAAALLREAAELTDNATLKAFLTKRAAAFLSDNYYDSDVAWMDLDSPIDVTIGPYETYMDELFNYKAAFEAFITLRNEAETDKLQKFSQYLQEIENNLPIDPKHRNPKLGALSPIRVVDEVYVGGEAVAGVQTAAYNLPNDEKVVKEKGSKRVMLKNVQEAKFKNVLTPISKVALDTTQLPHVSFDPFFTHILAHELMHGLGPHNITVGGKATTVRQELKEQYSALEEAKADISGLFALQYLIDKGVVAKETEQQMYVTFLAGVFRSVRFGINEAHGKGMALQFNYLLDEGAFEFNESSGTFSVNFGKIKDATRKLTGEIMTVQADGDYGKAKAMFEKYAVVRPQMQRVLDKLTDVPTDINPIFTLGQ